MHQLSVQLKNDNADRLTVLVKTNFAARSTPTEHEMRKKAEEQANNDPFHSKYGPWIAIGSKWEY